VRGRERGREGEKEGFYGRMWEGGSEGGRKGGREATHVPPSLFVPLLIISWPTSFPTLPPFLPPSISFQVHPHHGREVPASLHLQHTDRPNHQPRTACLGRDANGGPGREGKEGGRSRRRRRKNIIVSSLSARGLGKAHAFLRKNREEERERRVGVGGERMN